MELTGDALADIAEPIEELSGSFASVPVIDFGFFSITQYTFWLIYIIYRRFRKYSLQCLRIGII